SREHYNHVLKRDVFRGRIDCGLAAWFVRDWMDQHSRQITGIQPWVRCGRIDNRASVGRPSYRHTANLSGKMLAILSSLHHRYLIIIARPGVTANEAQPSVVVLYPLETDPGRRSTH